MLFGRYWHKRSKIKRYISQLQASGNLLFLMTYEKSVI